MNISLDFRHFFIFLPKKNEYFYCAILILILWGPGAVDRRAGAGRLLLVVHWSLWRSTSGRPQSSKCTSVTPPPPPATSTGTAESCDIQ